MSLLGRLTGKVKTAPPDECDALLAEQAMLAEHSNVRHAIGRLRKDVAHLRDNGPKRKEKRCEGEKLQR
jgi:hypothetical protein